MECGITLDICTHDLHGSVNFIKIYKKNTYDIKIRNDALDEGYNVVIAERKRKKNYHVIQDKPIYCRIDKYAKVIQE